MESIHECKTRVLFTSLYDLGKGPERSQLINKKRKKIKKSSGEKLNISTMKLC